MTYTVRPGDSLSKISQKYGISWRDLYNANKNVIGSNPNLIYSGQKYTIPGQSAPTPTETTQPKTPTQIGEGQGSIAGEKVSLTPWDQVLPWDQYFNPNLAQSAAQQTAAAFYAPQAQQGRQSIESSFADRGLTRSGMRGQNISDFYKELGQQHQAEIDQEYLGYKQEAEEERNMMQKQYEQSEGKIKPATTAYEAYNLEPPTTSAGRYGTTYLNWLNNILNK